MDDAGAVRLVEGEADLRAEAQRLIDRQRSLREPVRQALSLDQLHGDKAYAAGILEPVNRRDVHVVEGSKKLCFALEAGKPVGIGGLVLGGGLGFNARKYGLTSDNLKSTRIVTADGELHNCSATENADLFWALRGGGGKFSRSFP